MSDGRAILAQAEGSSGPELFFVISSITVTFWSLANRVTTSLLSRGCPRTFTWLASTHAGPATKGTVLSSAPGSFFLATDFLGLFLAAAFFFGTALVEAAPAAGVAGALVTAGADAGVSIGGGEEFVAGCASKLPES